MRWMKMKKKNKITKKTAMSFVKVAEAAQKKTAAKLVKVTIK